MARLTLEEKASLCQGSGPWHTRGIDRVDLPATQVNDGPHGVRVPSEGDAIGLVNSRPATCFPTASTMATTWDPDLLAQVGRAIGDEARALGTDVVLGPGANIKRSPLCGRNFEYFSEDPFLSGHLAAGLVAGIQSIGVGTSLKHFVANNQEHRRMTIDAVVDERTLREIYLAGFEHVVRTQQPWTIMCAYNRINGTYASDHHELLTSVLRDEWGFDGLVMTDWGAMNDRVAAVEAGCDLEMPGPVEGAADVLVAAVSNGRLDEAALDVVATRVVALALRAQPARDPNAAADLMINHQLARRVAARSCVLLRNDDDALPVRDGERVALLGLLAEKPRFQGTGSSRINPTRVEDLRTELTAELGDDRVVFARGYESPEELDEELLANAVAAASECDVAIVVVGLPDAYENEGDDRAHLRLPRTHDELVAAVAAAHDRVVVVVVNGAPVEMPWARDVEAILDAYLGGQAAGGGIADVLTGTVSPGGRLAETFPRRLEDVPSTSQFPGGPSIVEYREGVYVGYRFHDTVDADVLFPFGHGLGYEPVDWGEATLDVDTVSDADLSDGATVTVTVPVTNQGEGPTSEVVQVYVRDLEAAVHRPDRELKGFARVDLDPGQTAEVAIELDRRAFAWWDVEEHRWVVETGEVEVLVAASSRDVRSTLSLHVEGDRLTRRDVPRVYADPPAWLAVDRVSFETVLGRTVPPNDGFGKPFTRNTPLGALRKVVQGRLLLAGLERGLRRQYGDTPEVAPLVRAMLVEAPVRSLTQSGLSLEQVDTLLDLLNGQWGLGARRAYDQVTAALRNR
ncbi:glycoside hydrolase family 3 C-terminal domain-containing protein [Nitriliruptoria bacterium AS10]|nr:glycoside hydrolase family 3 C-terminal domain-containing protein [Salsipaludibacter albus]